MNSHCPSSMKPSMSSFANSWNFGTSPSTWRDEKAGLTSLRSRTCSAPSLLSTMFAHHVAQSPVMPLCSDQRALP